jgi:hypothetical protein
VAVDQSLVVFQWIASGFVAILLIIAKAAAGKPKRVESIGEKQRPIAGVWIGDIDSQSVFIELKMVGQLVEGSYVRGNYVTTINSGSYFPPKLYFEIVKPDGSELYFDGLVNVDSTEIKGRWSNFVDEYQWRMKRLKINAQFATRPVLLNDSLANFTDGNTSVPRSPLAPLLVYCALDALLRSFPKMVPQPSVAILATPVDASIITEAEPGHSSTIFSEEPTASEKLAPSAQAVEPFPHQYPDLGPAPAVRIYGRRCPKCECEWQDAFAFCLHCGYVQ